MTDMEEHVTQEQTASKHTASFREQIHKYFTTAYGKDYIYQPPESLLLFEQWLYAVAAGDAEFGATVMDRVCAAVVANEKAADDMPVHPAASGDTTEQAARAMYEAFHGTSGTPFEDQEPDVRGEYLRAAQIQGFRGLLADGRDRARIEKAKALYKLRTGRLDPLTLLDQMHTALTSPEETQ